MVTAAETVLGLLVDDSDCWRWVDDTVARAAGLNQTWQRMYELLLSVHQDVGDYSVAALIERTDDGAVCELIGRARARVAWASRPTTGVVAHASQEEFAAARQRLAQELDLLHMSDLRQNLARAQTDERGFRALLELARGKHSGLAPESTWKTSAVP